MEDLYTILNVSKDISAEELKQSFIAWKKEQQTLLKVGSLEEQSATAARISEVTILYKEAMGRTDLIYSKAKSDNVHPKPATNNSSITTTYNSPIRQCPKSIEKKSKNNVSKPTPSDNRYMNYHVEDAKRKLIIVSVLSVVILAGGVIYKVIQDYRMPTMTSSLLSNPFSTQKQKTPPKPPSPPEPPKPVMPEEPKTTVPGSSKPSSSNTGKNNDKQSTQTTDTQSKKNESTQNQNPGKTPAQRDAIQTLQHFHYNITQKDYRQAYSCLSDSLQGRMSYDGWVPGFKTTVSSTPSDIKVASESADRVVLTYNLKAVDNPGGTQNFSGTVVVIKTKNGWKINEITNKVK